MRQRLLLLSGLSRHIASSLELPTVFQHVVDSACELTGARYGALAIFDQTGQIEQFITNGVTEEERARIGPLPQGLGLLGWLQSLQEPLRLGDLADHPRSVGFPPNHPTMHTFLGAPIRHSDHALGNLYLTEKTAGVEFTPEDENLLVLFAAQAAMAIRNAQLYQQVQDLVVLEERERIGMDLHDGVIQSLYATGLKLESCLDDLTDEPDAVAPELQRSIDQLNQVIADIRSYIFHLRPGMLADTDLASAVGGLLKELQVNALLQVELREQPGACQDLSPEQMGELLLVAQEALTNVRKHARAHAVSAELEQAGGVFRMTFVDDGVGFEEGRPGAGQGLRNMRERVERLGGSVRVCSDPGDGTTLTIEVPLGEKED
ncbi:MAG: GAF domain-containing sensor histidine kinase [Dehalococcoidia bacterium]